MALVQDKVLPFNLLVGLAFIFRQYGVTRLCIQAWMSTSSFCLCVCVFRILISLTTITFKTHINAKNFLSVARAAFRQIVRNERGGAGLAMHRSLLKPQSTTSTWPPHTQSSCETSGMHRQEYELIHMASSRTRHDSSMHMYRHTWIR